MPVTDYQKVRSVGKGSFGTVYLVRHLKERKNYCMKVIKLTNIPKKERDACRHEVRLMQRLSHPNIVGFKDSFFAKQRSQLCIVMTYCDGGDLSERVKKQSRTGRKFSEDQILNWFVQISLGLHAMHQNNILHRDLKTQNIFLLGNGRLVLGDLGISKVLGGTMDMAKTCIGTPYYMSPELFRNEPYNNKSDIWAMGCILYELCTLKHAFDANSLSNLASKIIRGRYPPIDRKYSSGTRDLIKSMLAPKPTQRPLIHDVLRNPLIKRNIANFMSDIAERPKNRIGDGTMVVRKAILKVANGGGSNNLGQTMRRLDNNAAKDMESLIQQLKSLGLDNVVRKALKSSSASAGADDETSTTSSSRNSNRSSNDNYRKKTTSSHSNHSRGGGRRHGPPAPSRREIEARKRAERKQLAALRREEERKRQVKETLEKLRKEREVRQKALRQKKRAQQRNRMMAGNRYGHGGGGAGAARAARQRYKGPVRGGGMANQARSKEEMLAIARERSKQLERERRSKLQEEARRNQEAAEKRLKARNKRHQHHDKHSNKDQRAERRNVRDLDEWEVKQKAKQDLVAQRREREAVAFERRKKAEEERVTNLKAKWKDENDRMGRMLAEAKRKREERAKQDKLAKEAKAREDRDRKLAELKRQEEMAKAVKIAQAKREAAREQERRSAQMKDEGMAARRRLVQQQRRERSHKSREEPTSRNNDNRNEAWATGMNEKEVAPVCPSSPLPVKPRRTDYSGMTAREKVMAKKKERQRLKDEEAQRQFDMARHEIQKDRQWAKHAAQYQRMSSEAVVKRTGMAQGTQQVHNNNDHVKKSANNNNNINTSYEHEDIADEVLSRHDDLALAAQMPGSKYSDEDDSIDRTVDDSIEENVDNSIDGIANNEDESVILEEITSNTRLHEDHPIFQDSDDDDVFDDVEQNNNNSKASAVEEEEEDNDDDADDIYAEREEELQEELKMATMRCETLKQSLLKARQDQENVPSSHESKYSDDSTTEQQEYSAINNSIKPIDIFEEIEEGFDETYSESDEEDYGNDFNDSGAQDNVPPSDAQTGYLSKIEKRQKLIEVKCMEKLGRVRFEAAFGVILERYKRCERGDGDEDELEFTLAMSNLLGPEYKELVQYLEQLVLIKEGYMM